MKTLFSLLLLSLSCFSQKSNLYIYINNKSMIDTTTVKNNSIFYQEFKIDYNQEILRYIDYKVSRDNKLKKTIRMTGKKDSRNLNLVYENFNNNNPPKLVFKKNLENIITYDEIIGALDFKKLISIIKLFDSIFIINEEAKYDEFYIAKKVILKSELSKL